MLDQWFTQIAPHAPYLIVAFVLLLTGFGLPLPEDIIVLGAGYLCGAGYADPWIMFPLVMFMIMCADSIVFHLGKWYGHHVARLPLIGRYVTAERLLQMEKRVESHGGKFIFLARFMPVLRTAGIFASGGLKIPYWKFLVFDSAAACVTAPACFFISYALANNVQMVKHWILQSQLLLGLIALCVVGIISFIMIRRRQRRARHYQFLLERRMARQQLHTSHH